MNDYEERRHPTSFVCPECLQRGRESVVMQQNYGDGAIRLTCADFSICSWAKMTTEVEFNAKPNRIN